MPQMSNAEMRRADVLIRGGSTTPIAVWRLLKKSREVAAKKAPKGQKRKARKLGSSTVYNYCNGRTHPRAQVETRGRKDTLTKGDVRSLMQARRRLIQHTKNQRRVTYADIVKEAALEKDVSQTLQGRANECRGGRSATMMYAYPFTLCRRAVVATMDLSAKNLEVFSTHHWLSDARNVVALRLTEAVFE